MTIVTVRDPREIVDREGVASLLADQLAFIGYRQSRNEVAGMLERAMQSPSRAVLFICCDASDRAVGFAFGNVCGGLECGGDYLWLNELFIAEKHRHGGLGTALLEHIRKWAKENGCVYMALVTHPRNTVAQQVYAKNGFELEPLIWADTYL